MTHRQDVAIGRCDIFPFFRDDRVYRGLGSLRYVRLFCQALSNCALLRRHQLERPGAACVRQSTLSGKLARLIVSLSF